MRILVTGVSGQIARSLAEASRGLADAEVRLAGRPELDLTRPQSILPAMVAFRPDVVVNAAAYTAVDRAEAEPDLAHAVNCEGARAVAEAAAQLQAPVIQLSTDYVFDGRSRAPYREADETAPLNVYGRSKLAGERAVAEANPRHLILRTSGVYAPYGANFVRTMLRRAAEGGTLSVVDDQVTCPTFAPDISEAILTIARRWADGGWRAEHAGVTHLAGPDAVSWHAFAERVVAGARDRGGRWVSVAPIKTAQYPAPARRPANSRLATERLSAVFGIRLPRLEESLARCLDQLAPGRGVGGAAA
jgi:dTDP-4-dehydrorhamnose reductase